MKATAAEARTGTSPEPAERHVEVNGVRLRYLDWGNEGARPLVFLHGWMSNADVWLRVADAFRATHRVLSLDQRGHGGSGWAADYSAPRWVEDIAGFIEALGLRRPVLVGHSMGARNAHLFAADNPGVLERLVMVDGGPLTNPKPSAARAGYVHPVFDSIEEAVVARRTGAVKVPFAEEGWMREWVETALVRLEDGRWTWRCDPELQRQLHLTILDEDEAWRALERIDCPTLVVSKGSFEHGGSLAWPERMVGTIPDARLTVVPNSAHVIPLDNPGGLVHALRGFL
jgi:esterase